MYKLIYKLIYKPLIYKWVQLRLYISFSNEASSLTILLLTVLPEISRRTLHTRKLFQ